MFPEVLVVSSKLITILAVIVVVISVFSIGVFYLSAKSLFSTLSGYATSTGTANLSVESSVTINFTTNQINWGSGRVNAGSPSASRRTSGGKSSGMSWRRRIAILSATSVQGSPKTLVTRPS